MRYSKHRIAVITPIDTEYSGRLLEGAVSYARQHPQVGVVELHYRSDAPRQLQLPSPLGFDAALIWATRDAVWVESLLEVGLPVVAASADWPIERVPCVSFDAGGLVASAVDHLATLSPAILVHIQYRITGVTQVEGRCRQFEQAAARRGIPSCSHELMRPGEECDEILAWGSPLPTVVRRRLVAILHQLPKPAAVWCGVDYLGLRICEVAEELGLRVPEDVAVLGTGNFKAAECAPVSLSSVPLPGESIGFHALKVLHGQLSIGAEIPDFTPVLPPAAIGRESTLGRTVGNPLQRALTLIERRCCDGLTVREISATLGLSPQALHAQFVRHLGMPPGEVIRESRFREAKRLLLDPELKVAQVASRTGFNQQSKFADFFRRRAGLSARDWRRANPQQNNG